MVCVGVAKFLTHVGIKILDLNGALKSKITTGIESAPTCYISLKLNFLTVQVDVAPFLT